MRGEKECRKRLHNVCWGGGTKKSDWEEHGAWGVWKNRKEMKAWGWAK